jgi:hypothetical protein
VRYADDTLLGFTGPKAEAEEIKRRLGQFLQDELKLELNQEKTLITQARTQRARFLGYEIITQHSDRFLTNGRRSANGVTGLKVPKAVIKAKCARYMRHGKPVRRRELTNSDDHAIIASYGAEYRGIVQYYLMAGDVARLSRLHWVMATSLAQDPGRQVSLVGVEDGPQVQSDRRDSLRAAQMLSGQRGARRG